MTSPKKNLDSMSTWGDACTGFFFPYVSARGFFGGAPASPEFPNHLGPPRVVNVLREPGLGQKFPITLVGPFHVQ